jgi:hypothetical protein
LFFAGANVVQITPVELFTWQLAAASKQVKVGSTPTPHPCSQTLNEFVQLYEIACCNNRNSTRNKRSVLSSHLAAAAAPGVAAATEDADADAGPVGSFVDARGVNVRSTECIARGMRKDACRGRSEEAIVSPFIIGIRHLYRVISGFENVSKKRTMGVWAF